jgi:hypothetical protein
MFPNTKENRTRRSLQNLALPMHCCAHAFCDLSMTASVVHEKNCFDDQNLTPRIRAQNKLPPPHSLLLAPAPSAASDSSASSHCSSFGSSTLGLKAHSLRKI